MYGRTVLAADVPAQAPTGSPPAIVVQSPRSGARIPEDDLAGNTVPFKGKINDPDGDVNGFTIAGKPVRFADGTFFADVRVRSGRNEIVLRATDRAGHRTRKTVVVTITTGSNTGGGPPPCGDCVVRDGCGDAHGSPLDVRRARRSATKSTTRFTLIFCKEVSRSDLARNPPFGAYLLIHSGNVDADLQPGSAVRGQIRTGGSGSFPIRRIDDHTWRMDIPRKYIGARAPWAAYTSFVDNGKCPKTGHTEIDQRCTDIVRAKPG